MISCCSKFVCFRSLGVFVLFGGSPDFQKFRSRAADDTHKCQADFCLGAHAGMIVLSVQSCVIRPISRRSVRRASIFSKCFLCRSGHACELGAHPEDTVEALSSRSPAHLSLAKRAEDEKLIRLLESWPCVGGPSEGGVAQAMSRDCPHGAWTRSRPPTRSQSRPPTTCTPEEDQYFVQQLAQERRRQPEECVKFFKEGRPNPKDGRTARVPRIPALGS